MPTGLKQTSSVVSIGFDVNETGANTFTQGVTDLNLSPLDQEVFVVLAINLDPSYPDGIAETDTAVEASITTTSQSAVSSLAEANCLAYCLHEIKADGFGPDGGGVGFQTALETPPANLDYIGIVATNDFYVQVKGGANHVAKQVSGKMYGYRARADAAIYAALVQSEALSA